MKIESKVAHLNIKVNGSDIVPSADGKASIGIKVPDVPIREIKLNGTKVPPQDGIVNLNVSVGESKIEAIRVNGNPAPIEDKTAIVNVQVPIKKITLNG